MRNRQILTPEQRRTHYEIEKELATRLRGATRVERRALYSSLYDELFCRVPFHPQLARKASAEDTAQVVMSQMRFLRPFLSGDTTFLEIGPGDCALSFEVATIAKQVYAVDVSDEISKTRNSPDRFQMILSDGCSVPVPSGCVDVAYSNQLMEHLHPDDALDQLQAVYDALAPGGTYICITPNRLTGPHDVSGFFDDVATGFHLREYTISELNELFGRVGFSEVRLYLGARGIYKRFPMTPLMLSERFLESLPPLLRRPIARGLPGHLLFTGVRLVAIK
jgi:SAM-dependent methyltransferase